MQCHGFNHPARRGTVVHFYLALSSVLGHDVCGADEPHSKQSPHHRRLHQFATRCGWQILGPTTFARPVGQLEFDWDGAATITAVCRDVWERRLIQYEPRAVDASSVALLQAGRQAVFGTLPRMARCRYCDQARCWPRRWSRWQTPGTLEKGGNSLLLRRCQPETRAPALGVPTREPPASGRQSPCTSYIGSHTPPLDLGCSRC